jgi:outer membrane protein
MMRAALRSRRVGPVLVVGLAATSVPSPGAGQTFTVWDAVDAALASHPGVAAAAARVTAAEEQGDAARAAWLPGATVTASLLRFAEPMLVAPLHSFDVTEISFDPALLQGRMDARYTVFDGGARSSRIRAADAMHEASGFALDGMETQIIEETLAGYVGVLAARTVMEASEAQVAALEEEQARARRELDAGTAAEVDVLRASATLQEARAEAVRAAASLDLAERTLARLMSVDASLVSQAELVDLAARDDAAGGDVERSSEVQRATRAVTAAEARLAEERGGRFPSLEATAGVLEYGTAFGDYSFEWQAGLQLSWPVFTGGARSAQRRRAAAELTAAERDLEATRLRVAQAADAARTSVLEAAARAEALELAVAQWQEVARIEALALETGSGVQGDLLRAQAGLFLARAGHATARYDAILARARLARAEGRLDGGWMIESLEARP